MTQAIGAPRVAPHPRLLLSFLVGIAGAVAGLLPWLLGGGRLPLQNLWAVATMPEDMPFVLLPISQYHVTLLFSLVLLGGVFAGVALHFVRRRREAALWPAALGVAAVHLIALLQSFIVLAAGLDLFRDGRAVLYVVGMLGGTVIAALLAQLGLWMTLRGSAGVAALGVALAAVPFTTWVARWFLAVTGDAFAPPFLSTITPWLPAVVVGAALVWCGIRPMGRLAVWFVSLLALWMVPALFTAIQYGLGMRVLQGDLVEMAAASAQLFPLVLAEVWRPVLGALVIAVVGTIVRLVVERDRRSEAAPVSA